LLVGSSAYAFGVILAIFLICLFVGASLAPFVHRRAGDAALAVTLGLTAVALVLTLPIWEHLPAFFQGIGGQVSSFRGRELVRGAAAFTALFVPTTLMGLSFPLLLQWASGQQRSGVLVGKLTAINTLGAVAGSLATGYLVLPALGSQRSLVVVSAAFALSAVLAAWALGTPVSVRGRGARVAAFVLAGLAVVLGVRSPRWDLAKLTSGYNVYFDYGRGAEEILFVAEDTHGGVTTVTAKDGVHTLLTNGKFQGNDGAEISAQRFFAHYPAMFVRSYERALIIGLGTGTTLGTLAGYPFEHIEVAEISPSIVEASRRYFAKSGGAALDDPRVRLFHADGRNHLLVSDRSYDLIGIELTSVWFAGAASLYSREFYRLVKSRLSPNGVLQQWVQLHHISARDFATVVHTLRLEFTHVALFFGGGQGILVASNAPLEVSAAHLDALEATFGSTRPDRPLKSLVGDVIASEEGLDAFLSEAASGAGVASSDLVSTDDNLYLEYSTPRGNVLGWDSREQLVRQINAHRDVAAIQRMVGP
jgi:spermidine synthase